MRLDDELLDRYMAAECSEGEAAVVEEWLARNPEQGAGLSEFIGYSAKVSNPHHNSANTWDALKNELSTSHTQRRIPLYKWIGIAAGLVLVAVGIKYVSGNASSVTTKTYATAPGQRAAITLPSGAQVTLAPATKLTVTGNDVNLDGQALFIVNHSANSAFTVTAGNSSTRVLGTTFVVRAYQNDKSIRVVVADGKVQVSSQGNNSSVLSAGDAAQVTRTGTINLIPDINLAEALGWTQGKLVFDRAEFRDVLVELERSYNMTFRIADNDLATREVSGSLSADNLRAVTGELATLLNARIERNGNIITFYRK